MPGQLAELLKAQIATSYRDNPEKLLWCSRAGLPLWLDHVRERRLWPILDRLNIPRCGFRAFQHRGFEW